MKTGIVIGKFIPFHKGHVYLIEEASKKVDRLYVLPCFTDGELIPIGVRKEWVQDWVDNHYGGTCEIIVDIMIDQLPSSSDGRVSDYNVSATWASYLKNRFPDITHFIGSEPYIQMMADSIGADCILVDVNRSVVPVSATMIRNDFEDKKHMLATDKVRNEYVKRVAIVGIESSGKSTLTRDITGVLGVPYVEEYGRTYCEINSPLDDGKDYFLTRKDFHNIAIGHNRLMLKAYQKALNNNQNVIFSDTEHITTQVFFKRYLDASGDRKLQDMINFQMYDLVIWIEPVQFENDGTRRIVSEEEREAQRISLMAEFEANGVKLVRLSIEDDGYTPSCEERLYNALDILREHKIIR
ncbi:MAG: AAA family ATPase [Anaeroplasmataceae bacterium]